MSALEIQAQRDRLLDQLREVEAAYSILREALESSHSMLTESYLKADWKMVDNTHRILADALLRAGRGELKGHYCTTRAGENTCLECGKTVTAPKPEEP
jgi:hypothetical protein